MRIGLMGLNMGPACDPGVARDAATLAESLGYDSLWVGDHPVLPKPPGPESPFIPGYEFGAPLIALAYLAACTTTTLLGTGVLLVPQRHPVHLAKELATLDRLSGGRVVFGLGVGYLAVEFEALGVPMAARGPRTDEYLAAMRELWTGSAPSFQGHYVRFDGIEVLPVPARPGGPPVLVGGHSAAALERAVRHGGWFGWHLDPDRAGRKVDRLAALANDAGRPAVEVNITPPAPLSPALVEQYVAAGVDRLIVAPSLRSDASALLRFVHRNAPGELGLESDPDRWATSARPGVGKSPNAPRPRRGGP